MKNLKINNNEIFLLLAKCLNVPPLSFGANTVEPYKELQYITQKASYICTLMNNINMGIKNLKLYDDKETISNIKENLNIYQIELKENLEELEEFYNTRQKEGWS